MSSQGTGGPVKGRSRPTRQAAQQHKYADMKVENGYSYDDTPQSYGTDGGDPMARADLGKMKIQALRKYTKLYEVPGVHSQSTREDLIAAIKRHWSMANVTEDSVIQNMMRLRSRAN